VTDFADAEPRLWLDETKVLLVRAPRERAKPGHSLASDARNCLSSVLVGLAAHAIVFPWATAYSDPIVHSVGVINEASRNGLSRRYWEGLAHALNCAPSVLEHDDGDETAPLL
jgi:hypothetical protein